MGDVGVCGGVRYGGCRGVWRGEVWGCRGVWRGEVWGDVGVCGGVSMRCGGM